MWRTHPDSLSTNVPLLNFHRTLFPPHRYMSPAEPKDCIKCWQIFDIVRRHLGKHKEADAFFHKFIAPKTPWVHPTQVTSTFDTRLITPEPAPYFDPPSRFRVARRLMRAQASIIAEYDAYERAVEAGTAVNNEFDGRHADSWMSTDKKGSGGWWEYVELKRGDEWKEEVCRRHFPITCALFRPLREVSDGVDPSGCTGFCDSQNAELAGEKRDEIERERERESDRETGWQRKTEDRDIPRD